MLSKATELRLQGKSLRYIQKALNATDEEMDTFRAIEEQKIIEAIALVSERGYERKQACDEVGLCYQAVQNYLKCGVTIDWYLMQPSTPLSAMGGLRR
jgi:hypothetical protein